MGPALSGQRLTTLAALYRALWLALIGFMTRNLAAVLNGGALPCRSRQRWRRLRQPLAGGISGAYGRVHDPTPLF